MDGRLRTFVVKVLALLVAFGLCAPGQAKAETETDVRHGVVYLEGGIDLDGRWIPYDVCTAFFVGEEGDDPQYLLTDDSVTSIYEYYESGKVLGLDDGHGDVTKGHAAIRAYFDSKNYADATLVESDERTGLSLLKIEEPTSLRVPLALRVADESMVGSDLKVTGFPGISYFSYVISATSKGENDAGVTRGELGSMHAGGSSSPTTMETSAAVLPGNTGGPATDVGGNVLGVNTWRTEKDGKEVNYIVDISEGILLLDRNKVAYTLADGDSKPAEVGGNETQGRDGVTEVTQDGSEETGEKSKTDETDGLTGQDGDGTGSQQSQGAMPLWLVVLIALVGLAVAAVVAFAVVKRRKRGNEGQERLVLRGTAGALSSVRHGIPQGARITIGRDANSCDVVVPPMTPGVSGRHCQVWVEGDVAYVVDLGSTYGTRLESGEVVGTNDPLALRVGTKVFVGSQQEAFEVVIDHGE